jgi:hypothetical protein
LRGALLLTVMLITQNSFAATGWFARACERLTIKAPVTPPEFLQRVENEMREELYRQNRVSHHQFTLSHAPLEYLLQKPVGVEILPQLAGDMSPVRPVDIRLFANPDAGALDWEDHGTDLGDGPSLVLLFEDVPVRTGEGEVSVQDLVEHQFADILTKNSDISAHMRASTAAEFPPLRFRREYANHKVMWIEGDLPNFKVKRAMLLSLEAAYQALTEDSRYAQKKPAPAPTKH